jgi:CHASE2 domain-containing sensor protein
MINKIRHAIRNDLEAPAEQRAFGSGWLSGVAALVIGIADLLLILSSRHPELFSTKELGGLYKQPYFNLIVQTLLAIGFTLACMNMMLRRNRVLGFSAIVVVFLATMIGGMASSAAATDPDGSNLNNK